ncbi:DNA translocase FtsK 4TM domain-containing protein, partial [Akkermansiaceae bacterium]|nr:DNA translocase FtsK 4TM domain-containing protein [Akkermansiaceae bacterium]
MRLSLSMEVPCPLIMAKRQNKVSKQPAVLAREGGQEIVGIVLILAGILLFVSFLRFTPVDFVGWKVFGGFAPEGAADEPTKNLIGPVGAFLGFIFIGLFGAAAYLFSLAMIWLGV